MKYVSANSRLITFFGMQSTLMYLYQKEFQLSNRYVKNLDELQGHIIEGRDCVRIARVKGTNLTFRKYYLTYPSLPLRAIFAKGEEGILVLNLRQIYRKRLERTAV